ncbi:MAG: hypothetical protein COU85_00740 [Candidatus Portnoybacteria bacterium CG10_big_fil_rev_8_21_14_0_10_44_7]|uniref:BioF2-like acetyltransferase domain-containing protein n=1 Tax=Candidatus Portnoybacteria bacterium CG10_big_fil_rev_8_21_14_0_10_44_7 TaxID=1974816 RepID=A0A2M8KJA2_9BACT|nr:MAG: hypothetical protein COU85_00740 [Candidatus Portnoybacteria bacterium CG10_big_fil_rev_8_21_14_0_10_44_7]
MQTTSFLQSKEWAQFQTALGRPVFWVDGVLLVQMPLRLGKAYLYAPRCPATVFDADFLGRVAEIRKDYHLFLRVEPHIQGSALKISQTCFNKLSFDLQPAQTMILDLRIPAGQLLEKMHPKTRYNIRLAEKHGVKIKKGQEYMTDFWRLLQKTAKRDKIKIFSSAYYQKQLITTDNFRTEVWVAEYNQKVVAANLVNFYGETATYLHGAADYQYRRLMAPHLLQWAQISEAQKRGLRWYDFWGYDQQKWPGVSRFKKGFGGSVIQYPGAYDLIWRNFWYWLYKLGRRIIK